jgi:hypothetical protein
MAWAEKGLYQRYLFYCQNRFLSVIEFLFYFACLIDGADSFCDLISNYFELSQHLFWRPCEPKLTSAV